jgi:AcrR family transcriptional regulator
MVDEAHAMTPPVGGNRAVIIDAFMALLAERRIEEIDFAQVARRANVSLADCRKEFDSVLSVLDAFLRDIDRKVLDGGDSDVAEEPARERLFDVLMRRLEALTPHKAAIRSLARSARCNPGLALALNAFAVRSQSWMLTAADISSAGVRGAIRAQGMACLYSNVMRTWLDDDDPGQARTMAALDRELSRGASWSRFLDDLCHFIPRRRRYDRWSSRRRDDIDPIDQPAVV